MAVTQSKPEQYVHFSAGNSLCSVHYSLGWFKTGRGRAAIVFYSRKAVEDTCEQMPPLKEHGTLLAGRSRVTDVSTPELAHKAGVHGEKGLFWTSSAKELIVEPPAGGLVLKPLLLASPIVVWKDIKKVGNPKDSADVLTEQSMCELAWYVKEALLML
jgi:hypothetical protein